MQYRWTRLAVLMIGCAIGTANAIFGEERPMVSHPVDSTTTAPVPEAQDSSLQIELRSLRQMLREQVQRLEEQQATIAAQQQKLEQISRQLQPRSLSDGTAAKTAGAPLAAKLAIPAQAGANTTTAAQGAESQTVAALQKDLADTKKSLEDRIKAIGPFQFSGDFRVRYEPFFGGGPENAPALTKRHRERFRLRMNANAKLNDEFSGGFSVASGDAGDPISTNQTLTGFFTRKAFLIDRAFVQYQPTGFKPLRITAGKLAYPWVRTELTWDNDLNPEGIAEALSWDWNDRPLQHIGVVAFQLALNEIAGGRDSAVFGEQFQTTWKLYDRVKLGANMGFYDYRRPDAIAANQNPGGTTGSSGSFGGSNFSNFSGLLGGTRTYASRFGVLNAIARLDIDTGVRRFPLMLQLDFAQNTRACQNLHRFTDAGAAPPSCDASDRHAYWAEMQFGRNQERGDMRFGYTFIRIERDAVVSAFNFSDLRQATNVATHRLEYAYQANSNVQLSFTGLIGRPLATASSPVLERWLKRLQLDMVYRF